jgi:hypothetical protein
MSKTFDQGKEEVAKLCRYFATNRQAFLAPGVKEAHIRQSLIDPLFEALGWDVRNTAMVAPQYREVIPEDSLDVEGHQKAPDYTFRVGPLPKFYAEAKKCGVNIGADPAPAYQLRRYGWSAKVALSVLTDFEEFGVYDCTMRPRPSDKASHARIQYLRFDEYPDRWRELWDVFSREAVWSGAFDQYAASKRKRGTSEVDVEFLKEIEGWRDALARDLALRNKGLSLDDLNAAVQLTIDRVVFLRMAEDRGLEPYEQLLKLCERPDIYLRFMRELCRKADEKYNSGLFHFRKEPGVSEEPDRITPGLAVDDKVLRPILQSLYFEHGSPYHFGVLPVEILGTVYERFLGKVIRLTAGHQAKVEEKPEVRKAGGVYYTPAYIVDYIVKQTVGRKIEGRSPAQLAGVRDSKQPLRVLDMACGSGSFLLGAYQCLLDYCLKWYIEHNPETHAKAVYKDPRNGHWRLTIEEKKRILTTHIFGVDIDSQAVEVTKLSLLLKVLEGESEQSMHLALLPFNDRALPNLADNIKRGNSLIGSDYFTGKLIPRPEEMKRINPFDWKQGFPDAMRAGGFDCIIGNPPYGGQLSEGETVYLQAVFGRATRTCDRYELFLVQASKLLRTDGLFSMIIPASWLTGEKYLPSRQAVLQNLRPASAYALPFDVFREAYIDTAIVVFANSPGPGTCLVHCFPKKEKLSSVPGTLGTPVPVQAIRNDPLKRLSVVLSSVTAPIIRKLQEFSLTFGDWFEIQRGVQPYSRKKHSEDQIAKRFLHAGQQRSKEYLPELQGNELSRYWIAPERSSYIRYCDEIASSRPLRMFTGQRIVLRRLLTRRFRLQASMTDETLITTDNVLNFVGRAKEASVPFALGLLNSRLLSWVYVNSSMIAQKDDFPQVHISALSALPIPGGDRITRDRVVKLVDAMLSLQKQLQAARSTAQREVIQRQIDATDAEIDRLVYDLYGLTAEEIAIVEGKDQ